MTDPEFAALERRLAGVPEGGPHRPTVSGVFRDDLDAELLRDAALSPADPCPLYALADLCAERGDDASAAGWRWVARNGRRPRHTSGGERGGGPPAGAWYWTTDWGCMPGSSWPHGVPRALLARLSPPLPSPRGYADYPSAALALRDLARAAAALLAEGGAP